MNLHEYQSKELLARNGVPVQLGYVATSMDEAMDAAQKIESETKGGVWVIKAQVHAGGRGKAGGVKVAFSHDEVKDKASAILGMKIVNNQTGSAGKLVRKILIAEDVYYKGKQDPKEYYMSILLNRATGKNIVLYSPEGGMDIEEVSEKFPEKIFTETVEPGFGLTDFQARKIAFNLGLEGTAVKDMIKFVKGLYQTYVQNDASLVEINPVLRTSDNHIVAVDAKMSIDDNALYRHPDLEAMMDKDEEDPAELEAAEHSLNFVKLDGNVGCMVNGAGLAMATMDAIKLSGGEPANFLDVGGGANAERVEAGLRIILKDPNVKIVLINIFGGIVRCDRVANGVVQAYKNLGDIAVPMVVRLQGTNAEEGAAIIQESGLKVHGVTTIDEATEKIKELL
ncbi:ADP-forming succinate--CoA ligase subunit beta [Saccharicrinis sp. FJH2]|uniref:ADP-forming succinate--CoA ligase subunit beta n=1 Tax=Saccharicrinis sp. FJH65 TaxID=3344659 RepID=UPI0035F234B1